MQQANIYNQEKKHTYKRAQRIATMPSLLVLLKQHFQRCLHHHQPLKSKTGVTSETSKLANIKFMAINIHAEIQQ